MADPILLRMFPTFSKLIFYRGKKARLGYVELGDNLALSDDGVLSAPQRRVETYAGTTNGSGDFTVTYSPAFDEAPCVTPALVTASPSQTCRVSSATASGFTVRAEQRTTVTVLGVDVASATTSPVAGASVNVLVTEHD